MLAIPYPRKAILFVLFAIVAVAAIGGAAFAIAQGQRTANVEVRVWEDVNDPERNFISARPEGGSWSTLGTIRLPLTDGVSSSGRFRYGDITLAVPLPEGEAAQPVETRPAITSCADARTNGLTNIGEDAALALGLPDHLDDDNDGIYCESASAARPTATPTPTPRATAAPSDYEPYVGGGQVGSATYQADEDEFGVVRTTVHVVNDRSEYLYLRCWPREDRAAALGNLEVYVLPPTYGSWRFTDLQRETGYDVALMRLGSEDAWRGYWTVGSNDTLFFIVAVARDENGAWKATEPHVRVPQLVDRIGEAGNLLMRFSAESGYHTASWDVSDMSRTPAWANLTNCN